MKYILLIALLSFSMFNFAKDIEHTDFALEAETIKVEFYSTTNTGIIKPNGCSQCELDIYEFKGPMKIKKRGQEVSFEFFLNDYWNSTSATLFIHPKTNEVLRLNY